MSGRRIAMEYYPYRHGRAGWHRFTGVALAAMGLLFVGVGIMSAVRAIADDFLVFLWAAGFFAAMGLLGVRYGVKGATAARRLGTNRYGVTIEGDDVRSFEFDPWGDRDFTFLRSAVVRGREHPRKAHTYLHLELRDGKHRWLPTWRLDADDRARLFQRLGIDAARGARAERAPTPPPASVPPVVHDATASPAAAVTPTEPAGSVRTVALPQVVHCPPKLLRVAAAWLAATEEVLGIRFLDTAGREGHGVFRFGHDEDVRDAPWLEARVHDAFPMTAHGAASEWRHRLVLCNARDGAGRAIDLQLESEMLQDAGWWWDVTSRTVDPAALTRCRERFAELHTGREPVRADWRWLLAPEDRDTV